LFGFGSSQNNRIPSVGIFGSTTLLFSLLAALDDEADWSADQQYSEQQIPSLTGLILTFCTGGIKI
jgi:hypothetical protein